MLWIDETGIIGRSAVIMNKTQTPVMIEEAAAATWSLPRGTDYSLRYLTGRWAGEWNLQQQSIRPGETVLESKRGSTGIRTIRGLPSSGERTRRRDGRCVVRRAGMERIVADHGGAGPVAADSRDGRVQSV